MHGSRSRFSVIYHITVKGNRSIEELAKDIAVEQTIEVPEDCIPDSHKVEEIIGRIEKIEKTGGHENVYETVISYRCDTTGFTIPQFFNMLFGNISIKNNIRIVKVEIPEPLTGILTGPNYGIKGIRRITGVYGRPLACSAIKPMGISVKELADMAGRFAASGIDLIKDDHSIADQHFHPFNERVARVSEAVERANASTGGHTLYFPSVCAPFDKIEEMIGFAVSKGIRGILIAPLLVGMDTVHALAVRYNLIVMGHPSFAGSFTHDPVHGMTPEVMFGTLFRAIGADISIFPNWGGRFPFTKEECLGMAAALREPRKEWKRSFPCPAGGMNLERLREMCETFGEDTVLLIGGALMQDREGIGKAAKQFMDRLKAIYPDHFQDNPEQFASSCLFDKGSGKMAPSDILQSHDFSWTGRKKEIYKDKNPGDFKGITRSELTGTFGEKTAFDLRYFEIEPGGYSSFEKHVHEHVIIGARGSGVLYKQGKEFPLSVHDIAYVGPLEDHQLRNNGTEPFGFYCIVDHVRDKPVPAGRE